MLKLSFEHLFLDIAFEAKDSFAILGPNGSGKSLLLKIITHELYPKKLFKREVFGKTLTLEEARKTFGVVDSYMEYFYKQNSVRVLDAVLSSLKNSYDIYPFHNITSQDLEKAKELCERFKLKESQFTATLSLGELKRVLIARAIIHEPKILCLDEPTNGLDIKAKYEFFTLLESLENKKILITHDFNEINETYKEIILLKEGRIYKKTDTITSKDLTEVFDVSENILNKFNYLKFLFR
ncbi:ABC transporter, ATP-binding protein [Nautilia profundicola AmH]|uniref:ABC transporter, ATP-binding protein n=1 Tax=Nautilia profundicola (strain ATCC BAA-1463 / DSM 18972 / AmH) TaxID=598659 RepID=B9L9M8_NAUPA|nr:ATP-binding cassette domain-containing protein [Nautilia profundicola]ACM93610.1 ABC transporter, ATP-binding protein [Nautilia profundicola AmH]